MYVERRAGCGAVAGPAAWETSEQLLVTGTCYNKQQRVPYCFHSSEAEYSALLLSFFLLQLYLTHREAARRRCAAVLVVLMAQ